MSADLDKISVKKNVLGLMNVEQRPVFVINEGPVDLTYYPYTTQTYSNSNVRFLINPPSQQTIVNRLMYVQIPFRLTFTGTSVGPTLLQIGSNDAVRSFALSKVIQNMTLTIDNATTSVILYDAIQAFERYIMDETKKRDLGFVPGASDEYPQYVQYQQYGSSKNVLGGYGENGNNDCPNRGGYADITVVSDNGTQAIVDVRLTEPIWCSPMLWKHNNEKGIALCNQLQLVCNMAGDLSQLWSHAVSKTIGGTTYTGGENITAVSVNVAPSGNTYSQPALLVSYNEMSLIEKLPKSLQYNYFAINTYVNDQANAVAALAAGAPAISQNIQLGTTPKRMYVYLCRRRADRTISTTDTFARIDSISLNLGTRNGILAGANSHQLFQIASENGFQGNFDAWYKYSGGVLALEFGKDIPLDALNAPGKVAQNQLSVTVNYHSLDPTDSITFSLYVHVISDGVCVKEPGSAQFLTGVLRAEDILNASKISADEADLMYVQNPYGGDFLSGFKHFIKSAAPYVKKAWEVGKKVAPYAEKAAEVGLPLLMGLGYAEDEARAILKKEMMGGKAMSKAELKKRLKQY